MVDRHKLVDIEAIKVEGDPSPNFDGPLLAQYLKRLAGYANNLTKPEFNNPCVSYYGRLRFYSLQHTCQELNTLHEKALVQKNPTREDLERLRFLLHEHSKL